ncbi:MAG: hypothetical protein JO317_03005 [Verrucomicrobiae bacterium]|nr:hypothetical protein [Verrucomicrobiae bacterium]
MPRLFLLIGLLGLAASFHGRAQTPDTQAQSRELQNLGSLAAPSSDASDETQDEFGQIVPLQRNQPWSITPFASFRFFTTSNALLAERDETGDTVWVETQGLTAAYRVMPELRVAASYNYQLTRYDQTSFLDTDGQNADFNASYQLPYNLQLTAGLRGQWLTSPHQDVEVYREGDVYGNLVGTYDVCEDLLWFYGYQFDQKYANPRAFDRQEHTVFTGLSYRWCPDVVSQLVLRQNWQLYKFRAPSAFDSARQDWISSGSLQTIWQPLEWLEVTAFALGVYDNTVNADRDYNVYNLGGELRLFWKF